MSRPPKTLQPVTGEAMKPLITPNVNLNGNSAESLLENCSRIRAGLHEAISAIQRSDLAHGRNYQTAKDPFGQQASAANALNDRLMALTNMSREFEKLGYAIYKQAHPEFMIIDEDS